MPLTDIAVRSAKPQAKTVRLVQAPMALVACSALSSLSLATQGLSNVRRDHQLVGPISLYSLAVADSGERKTTSDAIFCPALRDWETARRQEMSPEIAKLAAATAVFEAKKVGILEAIKHKRRRAQERRARSANLRCWWGMRRCRRSSRGCSIRMRPRRRSRMRWPPAGRAAVCSRPRPVRCSVHTAWARTRFCATSRSSTCCGTAARWRSTGAPSPPPCCAAGRLTFGLMIQPEALRGVLERAGALLQRAGTLPRGTGFIARFLIAWPGSTQDTRAYRPAPEAMPQVALFGARIRELLAQPLATDAHGRLTPAVLDLSPRARTEWIRFHDEIERELGARGALRSVRDVAAKAAENVARLAALFHVLEHGASGTLRPRQPRPARCARNPRRAWTGVDGGKWAPAVRGDQSGAVGWPGMTVDDSI